MNKSITAGMTVRIKADSDAFSKRVWEDHRGSIDAIAAVVLVESLVYLDRCRHAVCGFHRNFPGEKLCGGWDIEIIESADMPEATEEMLPDPFFRKSP